MTGFHYRDRVLHVEGVSLQRLVSACGTPFYVYSTAVIQAQIASLRTALDEFRPHYCYAVKANSHRAVLRSIFDAGFGADIVSEGELRRCLSVGLSPAQITFSGVGKSEHEIRYALAQDIRQFNVESAAELLRLSALACDMQCVARVALRVNPDVAADTHEKITTGTAANKFGIALDDIPALYAQARRLPGIDVRGLHVHIGSQILDCAPYEQVFRRLAALVRQLRAAELPVTLLDLGGGFGLSYDARDQRQFDFARYAQLLREHIAPLGGEIMLEPGRYLVAPAGALISRVEYVKPTAQREFVILDAGMNDLIRPALYEAWHDVLPLQQADARTVCHRYDLVGPVCETGDTFARDRELAELKAGDGLAMMSAGAYGATMSSTYNTRPLIPEVLVSGDQFAVVRARQSYAELLAGEHLPPWLSEGEHAADDPASPIHPHR